jgi:hypothetical protein
MASPSIPASIPSSMLSSPELEFPAAAAITAADERANRAAVLNLRRSPVNSTATRTARSAVRGA